MRKNLKLLSLALAVLIATTVIPTSKLIVNAYAYNSGTCGPNLTWYYSDGTIYISGTGDMYNYYPDNYNKEDERWQSGIYSYQNAIKVVINEGVTSIGRGAFYKLEKLTSIKLPSSLQNVGDCAFAFCDKLDKVYTSDLKSWCNINWNIKNSSAHPLYYAKKLYINDVLETAIEIPSGVSQINDYAFYNCENISSVIIPKSVTSIGEYSFYNCNNLMSITIPDSITTIGESAFYSCKKLEKVNITDIEKWCGVDFSGVTSNPLYYAKNLYIDDVLETDIEIPYGVSQINDYAFYNCENMTSLIIPESITSIGNDAFSGCSSILSLTIPDSIKTISRFSFSRCKSIADIFFSNNIKNIEQNAFSGCEIKNIWYSGTAFEVENISIVENGNNSLNTAIWHYGCCSIGTTHIYDNTCDTKCNTCMRTREITHTYDNSCDTSCNICKYTRLITHTYSNNCDNKCNVCGIIRTVPDHVYDNLCDKYCNICGKSRIASEHIYDNACDTNCNECNQWRTVSAHIYDNACDKYCNECNQSRVVPNHIYDNVCDWTCNICDYIRTVPEHVYNNACDNKCNICGFLRIVPEHVYDNACDSKCNICNFIRTIKHTYETESNAIWCFNSTKHWKNCFICNIQVESESHCFDNTADTKCDICGYIRSISSDFTISSNQTIESFVLPHVKTVPSGYTGIYSYADLKKINNNPSGKYILMKDIDLYTENNLTTSIVTTDFKGVFNGNGYSINNCNITAMNAGLFSHNKGVICNLKIYKATIGDIFNYSNSNAAVGAVTAENSGIIRNCTVIDSVLMVSGGNTTLSGGIAGKNNPSGSILYCSVVRNDDCDGWAWAYSNPNITSPKIYSGGICGINYGNISYCSNNDFSVSSNATESSVYYAYSGGISGYNDGIIKNCYNAGHIIFKNHTNFYYASIAGYNDKSGRIENVYSTGWCANDAENVNLITYKNQGIVNDYCYNQHISYDSAHQVVSAVGEYGKKCSMYEMKEKSTYVGFDFENVWIMKTYPKLRAYDYSKCIDESSHTGGSATCCNKAVCEVCGISYGNLTTHTYNDWRIAYNANCTKQGLKVHSCIYCGLKETQRITTDKHIYNSIDDSECDVCGHIKVFIIGDLDFDEFITDADAEYLLMNTFFPEDYPINQECDFNGDALVNDADAEHLLMYTFFPEDYPLH